MMFRHSTLTILTVCLVLTAGLGLIPGNADAGDLVTSILPENTVMAVRFASIEQTEKHVNDFTMSAVSMPAGSKFVEIFSNEYKLENFDGIDKTKPVFMIAVGDSEFDVDGLTLYPISDEEAFLGHFDVEKGEDGYYSGDRCSMLIHDGYAVLERSNLKKAAGTWLEDKSKLTEFVSMKIDKEIDAAIWIPAKTLVDKYGEIIQSGIKDIMGEIAKAPVPGPPGVQERNAQMLSLAADWILELSKQVDEVGLEIALSADGAKFKKTVCLTEGSPFANYVNNTKLADVSSLLSVLTSDSWIAGIFNFDTSLYSLISEPLTEGMAKVGLDIEGMDDVWDLSAKAYTGGFAIDMNVGESMKNPVIQEQLVGIKDVESAKKLFDSMPELLKKSYGFSIPKEVAKPVIKKQEEAGTYKGIPYSTVDITFDIESPEAPNAAMYGAMDTSMSYALKDNIMAISTGDNIEKILDKIVEKTDPDPEAVKWLDRAGERNIFAMRLNLLQMLKFAKMAVEQQMKGMNPLAAVVIPSTSNNPGVTVFSNIGKNTITGRLNIPTKEIKAVQMAVMGGMMMQQQ